MPKISILSRALLLWLLLASGLAWAAAPQVQLDRNRVSAGETLTLRLTADGSTTGEPDFTPLEQDFDILSRGQSKVTSIVNGVISNTRQWTLQLAPKRMGRLMIPVISLGAEQSQATAVEVVADADRDPADDPRPVFMEAEVEHQNPYVQQSFGYRVKLYFRQQPQQAALSDPQVEGATVQRVGEDHGHEQVINGQTYIVIERSYLVTPQRSGPLTIQSPRLDAVMPEPRASSQRDPFADLDEAFGGSLFQGMPGMGSPGRRLVERASDLTLQIRPRPDDGSTSPWLPATSVQLSDEWTPTPPVFKVGEPLTRTLTITAQGATAAQLPDLDQGMLDGVQVYPDQPHAEDLSGVAAPTAIKSFKMALVPTRAGPLTLPEIRLDWWDTIDDAPRVAIIPARVVEVAPAPAGTAPPPVASTGPAVTAAPEAAAPAAPKPPMAGQPDAGWWPWLTLLLGLVWLATLGWWLRERRARQATPGAITVKPEEADESLRAARRQIERACQAGDARAARTALIRWGQIRWPAQSPSGLGELAGRLGGEGIDATLSTLDRAIYAPSSEVWDGAAAWTGLAPYLDRATAGGSRQTADPLPELYPPA
ncbi:BatD family protein [Thiobaca trueperi]|nr:BatD family protein [Thiobaca trueperi]